MGRPRLPVGQLAKVCYHRHRKGVTGDTYVWDCTGQQRRLRLTGSREAEALKLLRRKAAVLGGVQVEASGHSTLAHLLEDWFTNVVQCRGLRPQTEDTYRRRIERLKMVIGAILVEQLTPARVQGIAFEISQLTESVIERRLLRGVLKQALRYATMLAIFPANPYNAVEPMPRRSETPNPTALNPAQVKVFSDAFADYAADVSIYSSRRKAQLVVDIVLGVGGLRINEVLGLRNRDVDFDAGVVHVNGTLTYQPGVGVLRQDNLKARRQEREITITRGHVGYQALQAAWNESVDHSPDAPFIANVAPGSNPWFDARLIRHKSEAVRRMPEVEASLAETGLQPSDLTPHTFRRTVATIASHVVSPNMPLHFSAMPTSERSRPTTCIETRRSSAPRHSWSSRLLPSEASCPPPNGLVRSCSQTGIRTHVKGSWCVRLGAILMRWSCRRGTCTFSPRGEVFAEGTSSGRSSDD